VPRRYSTHGDLLYPLPRPSGAIHSCSYSRKRKEEWGEEKRKERREEVGETRVSPMDYGSLPFSFLI